MEDRGAYKAKVLARRAKLQNDIKDAVAADEFAQTRSGGLMKDWINHEVSELIKEILDEKLSYDDYVAKRAKVAAHREFLDFLANKPQQKTVAEQQLEVVNGQVTDIRAAEQAEKSQNPEG